jgi:hypothetical protein
MRIVTVKSDHAVRKLGCVADVCYSNREVFFGADVKLLQLK